MKLTIGQFAKASVLTIKMLRHYDRINLLIPVEKDFMTGYRYYDVSQIEIAEKIIKYKSMGFPLEKIKAILSEENNQYLIRMKLREQLLIVEKELENLRSIKSHLLTSLNQKEDITVAEHSEFSQKIAELLDRVAKDLQVRVIDELYNEGNITEKTAEEVGKELCSQLIKEHRLATIKGILKTVARETGTNIVNHLQVYNPELAKELQDSLSVFDEAIPFDDRLIQVWLREVEMTDLAISLKGTSKKAQQRIEHNMSERAWKLLQETMEKMGPVRLKLVEKTQSKLNGIMRELEQSGKILVGN